MRTILLTPYQNKIDREFLNSEEVAILCDTDSVVLPDADTSDNVVLNIVNVGSNNLLVTANSRQRINNDQDIALKPWECIRVVASESRWVIIGKYVEYVL